MERISVMKCEQSEAQCELKALEPRFSFAPKLPTRCCLSERKLASVQLA